MNIATTTNPDPIARAMATLPDGCYWVRLTGNDTLYEIAELRDGLFWATGCDVAMRPGNIADIGEKIAPYKPNPNPPAQGGDFWVRRTRESGWTIASFVGGLWYFTETSFGHPPGGVAMVGPRLEKPSGDRVG